MSAMKFRALSCLLAICLPMVVSAAEEAPQPAPKPSLWHRILHPFGARNPKEPKGKSTNFRQLEMDMQIEPNPAKLAESRQIKVTLTLTNRGGKMVQLEFPTSQRIEVLINTKSGQRVEQWSEDQAFSSEPTLVTVNPRERLEYSVNVSTRDLVAGETYLVEGFFPNFEPLRKSRPLTTEK
jgi:hypothetical protein